jgi:uncharacterized protein YuzE
MSSTKVKIQYSSDVDALLIRISDRNIDYAEEVGDFVLHYSPEGELVLIEVFQATQFLMSLLRSMIQREGVALA